MIVWAKLFSTLNAKSMTEKGEAVGKRKRHAPSTFMDLPSTTVTNVQQKIKTLRHALSESEENLKKARAEKAQADIDMARSMRYSAEWRALYLDQSAANCERYNALLVCFRAQGFAFERYLKKLAGEWKKVPETILVHDKTAAPLA